MESEPKRKKMEGRKKLKIIESLDLQLDGVNERLPDLCVKVF